MDAPVITTERLILRGHQRADFAACAAMWAEPAVTRFIGGAPLPADKVWGMLLRYVGHWRLLGFGYWVVSDRATGAFLGEAGLADYQRDLVPAFAGTPELGYALVPTAHGRGLASEAVTAVLAWADAQGLPRTVCMIDPANAPSVRLALAHGFARYADTVYAGDPTTLYERHRPA